MTTALIARQHYLDRIITTQLAAKPKATLVDIGSRTLDQARQVVEDARTEGYSVIRGPTLDPTSKEYVVVLSSRKQPRGVQHA